LTPWVKAKESRVRSSGIPLQANVFATLQPPARSARCTDNPTKKGPENQGIVSIWRLLGLLDYVASGSDLLIIDCMEKFFCGPGHTRGHFAVHDRLLQAWLEQT
jgi:hypothetical protein